MDKRWVQTWGQAHSALSFFYYPSCKKTYRLVICSAISGESIRAELSNECSKNDVYIGAVTVAKCDKNGNAIEEFKKVTVNSKEKIKLCAGGIAKTDPMELNIKAGEYFCISVYVEKGSLRSGNLIDNAELITVKGDVSQEKAVVNQRRKRDKVREVASKVLKMYFHKPIPLFQSVQFLNGDGASSIVVFGDSISQQGYWTNRFEARIRNEYYGRYSVINKSIMGNRMLFNYNKRFICKGLFGTGGLNRLQRDVLDYPDAEYVIFALGTNDFLQYNTIAAPKSEKPTAKQLFDAVAEISRMLKKHNKKLIVFNVLNFGYCIDSRPEKEAMVKEYNALLEENKDMFHGVYNQADLCIDPDNPNCSAKIYLGKDYLHPNRLGGDTVADNINLNWFKETE